ncbi:MAG: ribonuclease H-like domain-containing protein [Candidatus Lokiarchaeota archaeon]|nr:ribonuclease H-like domain-containing protein [Candidatus Lokiarchaeota archaeon]
MEYYYNSENFDITHLIKEFEGKKLEDIFPNQRVISNGMGEFLEFFWKCEDVPVHLKILSTKNKLLRNLKSVYYVGEITEKTLIERGVKTLYDLRANLRFRSSANKIIDLICKKDFSNLSKNKYIYDLDTSFCFSKGDLLFIDIETLGLYDSPIIIVGLGFYKNNVYNIHQFFARGLEEEIAICEHLRVKILPNYKCFLSYNGKSFDIPYIANRFLYYFDENPMIYEDDPPYKKSNTKFGHIDLYHNCRRQFKGEFSNYELTTIEQELLNLKRENELPSSLVGLCYRKFLRDPNKYIGLIKECIDHNYYDMYSMPLIFEKLLNRNKTK